MRTYFGSIRERSGKNIMQKTLKTTPIGKKKNSRHVRLQSAVSFAISRQIPSSSFRLVQNEINSVCDSLFDIKCLFKHNNNNNNNNNIFIHPVMLYH